MYSNNSVSCSKIYKVTGSTYDVKSPYGGVPENLGINFAVSLIIVMVFCVIRKRVRGNGKDALIGSNGWIKIFFGKKYDESEDDSVETQADGVSDKGFFDWIIVVFKLSEADFRKRAGCDAIHYLRFQKLLLIRYTVGVCFFSIVMILPVNLSGNNVAEKNHFSTTTLANLSSDSKVIWLHTIFAFLYLAVLVVMAWKFSQAIETDSDPMSEHTVLISHVAKSATKDQIKQHFDEIYGEGSVNNVHFAYNISKLTVIDRRVTAASLGRHTYANGKTKDTKVSTNIIFPCCPCYKETHNGWEYFTGEEQRYKNDFLREKDGVLRYKTLRIIFVTFTKPSFALRCIQDYRVLGGNHKASSVSTAIKSKKWTVERAPSPSNIIWENLSADPKYWWLRTGLINICLFLFALFFTTPPVLLAGWKRLQSLVEDKIEPPDSPFLSQILPTIVLWLVTAILPSLVSKASYYEYQWTRTKQEKSVMFKVYVFLLCMVVILPSLALTSLDALFEITVRGDLQSISDRMKCIFLPNSGAFFVNYVITSALIGTALELVRLPELFVYGIRMCYTKDEGERLLVKKEAVVEFPFGIQYAWMITTYSIIINYSIACPVVVPCGLLYLVLKHFVDRYNLFFNYRSPANKYMGPSVHNTAVYFLIFSTFLLPFCITFYSIIRLGIKHPRTIFALVLLLITLTIFIIKVCGWCCGWFAARCFTYRYQRLRSSKKQKEISTEEEEEISTEEEEEISTDSETPEAYLPEVLKSSDDETPEDNHATNSRRRHYGTNDAVNRVTDYDYSDYLRQSDDVELPLDEVRHKSENFDV